MINQITPISQKTSKLNPISKGLLQTRHIQARLKNRGTDDAKPENGILWNPITASSYLVPITRWIE